ncbi:stage II sporulation protein P [Clostridium cavendishii DSM 21758]|uniref:Stage II sporulation protein P n=1 Tax=Clostridium cavendishii DSM 21758 TaxID=1121302 RepID=A0A1M6F7W9_9CLOT|nr:stage II sporulation protein P [Clostridium cavendishii]SHI93807.1 stage II sporulation protein P [Clostridium cavendishii DSM 21758]
MYNILKYDRKFKISLASLMLIVLILFSLFILRVINITLNKKGADNLVYIQLLNSSMPVIKETYYDEQSYAENKTTISSLALEAVNLNILDWVDYRIPLLKDSNSNNVSMFTPLKLYSKTISKTNTKNETKKIKSLKAKPAYNPSLKKTLNQGKPEILLYHTHTTESYLPCKQDSTNNNSNVVAIGIELEKELEKNYGISVIHDKTIHSIQYDNSYYRSAETVKTYLKKYGDFKLIIDLHRDSMGNAKKNNFLVNMNNENVAKIMFTTAQNNPHYKENLKVVNSLNTKSAELFPEFCRGIYTHKRGKNAFNQTLNKNSILIEVGSEGNTIDEAKASSKYIARLIAEILNK